MQEPKPQPVAVILLVPGNARVRRAARGRIPAVQPRLGLVTTEMKDSQGAMLAGTSEQKWQSTGKFSHVWTLQGAALPCRGGKKRLAIDTALAFAMPDACCFVECTGTASHCSH